MPIFVSAIATSLLVSCATALSFCALQTQDRSPWLVAWAPPADISPHYSRSLGCCASDRVLS